MIKLIATDFDNTLISYEKGKERISPILIDFFEKFIQNGFHVGIVSGRDKWGFQGTLLSRGETWGKRFPDYIIAREAYIFKINNGDYEESVEYNSVVFEKISRTIREVSAHIETILKRIEQSGIAINKWYIFSDYAIEIHVADNYNKAVDILNDTLKEFNIKGASVHRNENMITIYSEFAGKGNTLKALAESFNIKPDEVLAIGDSFNDLSMLDGHLGFVGACVENADENLKQIVLKNGGYVGKGNAFEGILDIINQLTSEGKFPEIE